MDTERIHMNNDDMMHEGFRYHTVMNDQKQPSSGGSHYNSGCSGCLTMVLLLAAVGVGIAAVRKSDFTVHPAA